MTLPEETKTQRQCREFCTGLQSHVKYAWGRGADGQFLAEDSRLTHRAWEEAQRLAREETPAEARITPLPQPTAAQTRA